MFKRVLTAVVASLPTVLAPARSGLAQPVLTLEGECPGLLRAEVRNARPEKFILLLYAPHDGTFVLPRGNWCQGVQLGLGWRGLRQVAGVVADQNGVALFEGEVNSLACGGFLQTLNYPSGGCEISNVVRIPR